ncbi:MAG: hypothetical protein C4K47_03240 [Candidatus Thorarchaeota archaeon]|nr:MAG: hypothetical protein C4K47_03240 [Candidatus Thorarchaeota archaeon]
MTSRTLVVLDFDQTVLRTGHEEDGSAVLLKLKGMGVELCIASRNDRYSLHRKLESLFIDRAFRYVMSDFRPKFYQMRHILWLYSGSGIVFSRVIFVDDDLQNIEQMKANVPNIDCYQMGVDLQGIQDLPRVVVSDGSD